MSKVRQERTAEQIQVTLSELFLKEVSDPRLAGVTITEVLIDRELQHANVYVNALGDDAREKEVLEGLESASGFLRSQVAQRLDLRSAPFIHYHWDPRLRYAEEVNDLLDRLDIPPAAESGESTPSDE
ncbi:MAG: 30S ribosome-binding factor RbfA [Anaerolineae bacterium]|nr:30S ribosome-binding factor RbfA [Anaerolineales bacterium]MCB8934383.1 30S ribosome-binding factor RbfA [Promineifilum sp.]MCW5847345.1 30S ribosome-binding factor RbfA [Anaerolineae bacterium]